MVERAEDKALRKNERTEPAGAARGGGGCREADVDMNSPSTPSRLVMALAWIKARRMRDQVFSVDLFSDPAWDMLLDLYVNLCRGLLVSITDLCIASSAPMTTGLRWISILENRGLIMREADATDRRRWNVSLTPCGVEKMEAALDAVRQDGLQLGLGRVRIIK